MIDHLGTDAAADGITTDEANTILEIANTILEILLINFGPSNTTRDLADVEHEYEAAGGVTGGVAHD